VICLDFKANAQMHERAIEIFAASPMNIDNFAVMNITGIRSYFSLIKFSHTIFAMPFALIGFFMAINEHPVGSPLLLFVKVVLCMVFARSAAMAFNRYLDRDIDAKNPRTKVREIPAGVITPKNALLFVILNSILFIATTWFINPLCFYLSFIALFVILFYSYTKRFTWLCHLVLGLGLSLAPIGAYLAVTAEFSFLPLLFSLAVITWVSGFDIIYSLQDDEFDKSEQLYSMPSSLGRTNALMISNVLHFISAAAVATAGVIGGFSWIYFIGVAFFTAMLIYQHRLVKPDDLSKVNIAFMTTNGIASVCFAVFTIADIYLG
jgi:4-hydroxybenzoate polyprenyltransferase